MRGQCLINFSRGLKVEGIEVMGVTCLKSLMVQKLLIKLKNCADECGMSFEFLTFKFL